MSQRRIGELLMDEGFLGERDLDFAVAVQAAAGYSEKMGAVLVGQGFSNRERIARALARQAGWEYYHGPYIPDERAVEVLGFTFIEEHRVFPLKCEPGPAFVMPDADDTRATDFLLSSFGRETLFYIAIEADIRDAISLLGRPPVPVSAGPLTDVRQILKDAVTWGATDIHIEPSLATVNLRLRVDGVLHFYRAFPRGELSRIINIFFNRAGISAGDFLHFHDARFEEECHGRRVDVRLSHIPSVNGPSLVLRLLDKSRSALPLSALGYAPEHQRRLMQAVKRPHGLILFTGPTGCGKTTSLYSLLSELKGLPVKVVTAEDPVEVRLPLVTQVPVDTRKDQDFHHITRALLRHDPDIILIGEIRDEKTAREAVRAAVTGHRVLTTLHTNDAVSAIFRLHDLGMDHARISHTLTGVVSQRLVRVLCPRCKELKQGGLEYAPRGCAFCFDGFKGRTVVAEVMEIDDEMRFLIEQGLVQEMSAKYRSRPGALTIRRDAERLVNEGLVSRDEVERVFG